MPSGSLMKTTSSGSSSARGMAESTSHWWTSYPRFAAIGKSRRIEENLAVGAKDSLNYDLGWLVPWTKTRYAL